jgi:integrase
MSKTAVAVATMDDWFLLWDQHRDVTDSRKKADRTRYAKYVQPRFGRLTITRINAPAIEEHVQSLLADGVGPFTVDAALAVIRGVLGYAVESGDLKRNASAGIAVKEAEPFRTLEADDVLTDDQVEALAREINPDFRALILLAATYGLSWSECIGLQVSDLDLKKRSLVVGRILAVEVSGKIQYRHDKGRSIFLDSEMIRELAAHLTLTETYREKADGDWLFVTSQGTQPLRPNFNKFYLRPALERADLAPRSVTFHTLRHTAARRMLERGVPVEVVATALGHKSVVTTKRFYAHFIPPAKP